MFDLLTITLLAGVVMIGLAVTGSAEQLLTALTGDPSAATRRSGRTAVAVADGVVLAAIGAVVAIVASARSDRNLVRAGTAAEQRLLCRLVAASSRGSSATYRRWPPMGRPSPVSASAVSSSGRLT
ncbi:hypothetical protein C8039_09930 [Halogeometricum sp. wsp3]|nr:hypothetical protein C8039_09930 [Halogeometricum sp. wsp3]